MKLAQLINGKIPMVVIQSVLPVMQNVQHALDLHTHNAQNALVAII